MTIRSILIANRGEIACRIIRTVQDLGIRAIAGYSEADADAPHVAMADDGVLIGPAPAGQSYLKADRVIAAAKQTGANAIHPGYGFLSENADFARAVRDAGLIFIGPSAEAIQAMGNKAQAKRLMMAANVPCVPGYEGADQTDETLMAQAQHLGLPVMIKAAAGGGGRGMRLVSRADDLASGLALARAEAENAFGSAELILEKAVQHPRHVEFQIMADSQGRIVHLGERDCSVQRRHQKVIEEAPCPVMTPDLRAAMGAAAVEAARAVGYCGAGTVEFLLEASGAFYFLEMNTRLQVEHPITEMVTGQDLVALQILVAQGQALPFGQEDLRFSGHAIEARLYAEDPTNDYLPATGPIDLWRPASGQHVRVDAGIAAGQEVSPFYDPMLAKIVAWGQTRAVARQRLIKAVRDTVLLGTKTNSAFLVDVLEDEGFASGAATTDFLSTAFPDGYSAAATSDAALSIATVLFLLADQRAALAHAGYVSTNLLGWTSAALLAMEVSITQEGVLYQLRVLAQGDGWQVTHADTTRTVQILAHKGDHARVMVDGVALDVTYHTRGDRIGLAVGACRHAFERLKPGRSGEDAASSGRVTAPMPGLVVDVMADKDALVAKGQLLCVLEAMKMQHQITAPADGVICAVHVAKGQQVSAGDEMFEITTSQA